MQTILHLTALCPGRTNSPLIAGFMLARIELFFIDMISGPVAQLDRAADF